MAAQHVLAIDQGTGSTKCLLFDERGAVIARAAAPLQAAFVRPGWVEQAPDAVIDSVRAAVSQCLGQAPGARVVSIGLSTQRESVLAWDRQSGKALAPLLSWQDRRQNEFCRRLAQQGAGAEVLDRSGLPLDPMFSAAKARWLLDDLDVGRSGPAAADVCLGTVDSWLAHWLAGCHVIEIGNAARTQLVDVATGQWDPVLLEIFGIPSAVLPEIIPSTGTALKVLPDSGMHALAGVPVHAILGDSHAALFAHGQPSHPVVKVTYGTGSSVVAPLADPHQRKPGIATTIVWGDPEPRWALEGNITATGATLAWLSSLLETEPDQLAELAAGAASDGVHIVPAFGGLSAPYWDGQAVAIVDGLTLGTDRARLARAALESTALQVADVIDAAGVDDGARIYADGGASDNDMLMQLQADTTGLTVLRSRTPELSALGAARMAAETAQLTSSGALAFEVGYDSFEPGPPDHQLRAGWRLAVARAQLRGEQR